MSVSERKRGVLAGVVGLGLPALLTAAALTASSSAYAATACYPPGSPYCPPDPSPSSSSASPTPGGSTGGGTTGGGTTGGGTVPTPSVTPSSPAPTDPVEQAVDAIEDAVDAALASLPGSETNVLDGSFAGGVEEGLASLGAEVLSDNVQEAITGALQQVVAVVGGAGDLESLTQNQVAQLIQTLAGTVPGVPDTSATDGVSTTPAYTPGGDVTFTVTHVKVGSVVTLVLTFTNGTTLNLARRAFGASVIGVHLNPDGSGTLVLSGRADESGVVRLTAPASALGTSGAAGAQALMGKTIVTVLAESQNGQRVVFGRSGADTPAVRPTLSVSPARLPLGGRVTLSGTAGPGQKLEILARTGSSGYRVIKTITVPSTGHYSYSVIPTQNTGYSVRAVSFHDTANSAGASAGVRQGITQAVQRTGAGTYSFSGRVSPARAGQVVQVFRTGSNGGYVLVGEGRTGEGGSWGFVRHFTGTGTFKFFSRVAPSQSFLAGVSGVKSISVN